MGWNPVCYNYRATLISKSSCLKPVDTFRGSPWENGYVESFHSRLRDELTNREEFHNLAEAKHLADAWRLDYNHRRPHSSLGYRTPAEFAAGCAASGFATLSPQQHSRNPEVLTQPLLS